MSLSPQIISTEWRWAAGWSLAILALSCLPYLIVAQAAPPGWRFNGILVNPQDGNSYLAKIEQGVQGNWLFHLTYTPEPHDGAFIFTFYLFLGHLARWLSLPNILIFHLARLLAGLGLLLLAFRFVALVTPNRVERRLAFILILCASGLGWLGLILGHFPIDLWVPEAFTPYSLYANPHFPLAMALMLFIFSQTISQPADAPTFKPSNFKTLLFSGLAALALATVLPFALLTVWAVLIFFIAWEYLATRRLPWRHIWLTLVVIFFAAPLILYQYWVSVNNPILAGWGAQNITPAPSPLNLGLGYGLVGLFALIGAALIAQKIWQYRHKLKPAMLQPEQPNPVMAEQFVLCWALITLILVYIPFELQRRLITGLHLPVCILAALALSRWPVLTGLKPFYQRLLRLGVVSLSLLQTLFIWSLPLLGALQDPAVSYTTGLLFIRQDEVAAFEWLGSQVRPDEVILASPRLGLFVPGQTGARAFYGHSFETIEAKAKEAQLQAFFRGEQQAVSPPADYIIYGPSEQALGRPEQLSRLPVAFSSGEVTVYKVAGEQGSGE